ncbi:sporulation protein YqfC [Anaerobranca californiensis DSM 14826]|jgi:sporulation protein YqfC|uniref:Sporulation protein YqfC n=1 Tax=Anaerobranca californiensis DSM 14826 TaxID=1120989 RepID=A0A1M6N566_9FIRM|nr:sporulation protein YqfC [Anaerobranca californiensis]SHJ90895.1 sporulation protein YqfC [Anaerobranca californiensis DSM 14826]
MSKKADKIKLGLAEFFDIPKDIILNLPRIIIIGQIQVYIENHQGIKEFRDDYVKIDLPQGFLEIKGKNLLLRNVYSDDLLLDGEINSINFIK